MEIVLIFALSIFSLVLIVVVYQQQKKYRKLERLLDYNNEKLEDLQVNFGRFAPQEVIEQLTDATGKYKPGMKNVTVLFADLKGFTHMCSQLDPPVVVSILNGYFRAMTKVIAENHGRVTELMGDGILALFGALVNNPWHVQDAVNGALAMRKALKEYNQELREKSLPELEFGIGIHQGEVLAGVMGNIELSKFAVVGDPINLAARVEALTRDLGVDLLITEKVKNQLNGKFQLKKMQPMPVKGKKNPLTTYFVQE